MSSGGGKPAWLVQIKNSARPDLKKLRDSRLRDRFEQIAATLKTDPFAPTDSFEKLHPLGSRLYSRRLNSQHRVVYRIDEAARVVTIYSAWSHYE